MIVFCIIPIQFLWGQGSSVLPNKHTYSCSPKNSHLVYINHMEGVEMWEAVNQCVPKRSGRWRSQEVTHLLVSPSNGAQRARKMTASLWLNAHRDSPGSQSGIQKHSQAHIFSQQFIFLLFSLLKCNTSLQLAHLKTLIKIGSLLVCPWYQEIIPFEIQIFPFLSSCYNFEIRLFNQVSCFSYLVWRKNRRWGRLEKRKNYFPLLK